MKIDPTKSKLVFDVKHESPLHSCVFDPSGRFVLCGGRSRELVVVDVASRKKSLLPGHDSWIESIARAGTDLVLTGDYVGRLIAWDCSGAEPKQRWNIEAHASAIHAISLSVDGKTFATCDHDGFVRTWQTSDGKRLHELPQIDFPVYGVALHPDGSRIVTVDLKPIKPRIKVSEIVSGKEQLVIEVPEMSGYRRSEDVEWTGIRTLLLSPDGQTIVAGGRNGWDGVACLQLFDMATGKPKRKLLSTLKGATYYGAKYHPHGFLLASAGEVGKGEVRIWNPERDETVSTIGTPGPCMGLDVHPSGESLAVAQMISPGGKQYPDSGLLSVYAWIA